MTALPCPIDWRPESWARLSPAEQTYEAGMDAIRRALPASERWRVSELDNAVGMRLADATRG